MAARIEGPLDVKFRHNGPARRWEWELNGDLEYRVGSAQSSRVLTIHEGATTDFASVPRVVRWLVPNWSRGHAMTATIHDALYRGDAAHFTYVIKKENQPDEPLPRPTRKEADDIYREANNVVAGFGRGLWWWQRQLAYWGVRTFGRGAYK